MHSKLDGITLGLADDNSSKDKTTNLTRPPSIKCLPSCHIQENQVQLSHSHNQHYDFFIHQRLFCDTATHLWQVTCQKPERKYFLELAYPDFCYFLANHDQFSNNKTTCESWPEQSDTVQTEGKLVQLIWQFAEDNHAHVQILIRNPYVTKIRRDLAMTFTSYVANTGGLLGLCIGCSFVSFAEIIYHFIVKLASCYRH